MDKKTKGAWLIHHTNKLQGVVNQQGYEKTYVAGKSGVLLSAISADDELTIDRSRLEALAKASSINVMLELPTLLDRLRSQELIDVSASGAVAVYGVTAATVLQHTTDVFNNLEPTQTEEAAIALAELASFSPVDSKEALLKISDEHKLARAESDQLLFDCDQIGFVESEQYGKEQKLLFNGNLFRRGTADKIVAVMNSLSPAEMASFNDFNELLKKKACIDVESAQKMLGLPLFQKTCAVGIFDISVVSNDSVNAGFVTLPSAFSKFSNSMVDDALDLAKAFLSSITYGITKSNYARGQIRMVEALLGALVRGESVGPVDAIAQDYRILEMKGVVKVYQGSKKGRTGPMLKLLKKEVGELALEAIKKGDVSEHSLSILPSAAVTRFNGPEVNRVVIRRKQVASSPKSTNDILSALRTGAV
ncbi:hypothetical protein [Pseudomonas sp. UBA7530]|uniref:hypothetical protein n=1 Tax=Pseudomonas sp. UBA7530 TaxID=1947341 RepID=UPI0025EE6DDC|nr:hypothetical protein [Pseudomonas sp. UBA7530]